MLGVLNSASAISAAFFIDCAGDAGIAGRRQRQDQADLDLPGADASRRAAPAGSAAAASRRDQAGIARSRPPSHAAPLASSPASQVRRDGSAAGALRLRDRDMAVLLDG